MLKESAMFAMLIKGVRLPLPVIHPQTGISVITTHVSNKLVGLIITSRMPYVNSSDSKTQQLEGFVA